MTKSTHPEIPEGFDPDFPSRLHMAMGGRSQRDFASASGISSAVLNQYLKGKSEPTRPILIAMANAAHVNLQWLMTGEGAMRPSTTHHQKEIYTVSQQVQSDFEKNLRVIADFRDEIIKQNPGRSEADFTSRRMHGDAMEPTLNNKELFLVDTTEANPETISDGVYVFFMEGQEWTRRLSRQPGGSLQIICDNPAYPTVSLSLNNLPADFFIEGRVIWAGRKI